MKPWFMHNMWIAYAVLPLLIAAVFQIASRALLWRCICKTQHREMYYAEAVLQALRWPLVLLVWTLALSTAVTIAFAHHYFPDWAETELQSRKVLMVFITCWFFIRLVRYGESGYVRTSTSHKKQIDQTVARALSQLATIAIVILGGLVIMQMLHIPIAGVLAFGGIGGASIAFASKDLLANFFGGFIVYTDKPFKVGDWIRSPEKEIEGTVEYIGWRMTRIRTFEKRPLYVPNSIFLTITVENASRMQHRRIKTLVGVRYQDAPKIDAITQDIRAMLLAHPEIDHRQNVIVNLVEFAASALNIMVLAYVKETQSVAFQAIQHAIFMQILGIIAQHQAECAFPTRTICMEPTSSPSMLP